MARQTKAKPLAARQQASSVDGELRYSLWKSAGLLVLTGVSSAIYQLSLSPSHGSIPAAEYRNGIAVAFATVAVVGHGVGWSHSLLRLPRATFLLTSLAMWTPFLQFLLLPTARIFGPALSAALINALTYGPMMILAINIMATTLDAVMPFQRAEHALAFSTSLSSAAALTVTSSISDSYILGIVGSHPLLTRPILPLFIPPLAILSIPSQRLAWLAALPYMFLLVLTPHTPFSAPAGLLERAMDDIGYTILAREESLTGYLSVVENRVTGYRVLRCDHSLLGGEWVPGLGSWPGGEGYNGSIGVVAEPVYAVFVMLEAVRLVQDDTSQIENKAAASPTSLGPIVPDQQASALVIGLGIGTTPGALVSHGINTTVVEIDPAVHKLALEYFKLPKNHTAYIQDARAFVQREVAKLTEAEQLRRVSPDNLAEEEVVHGRYEYIVHDVFTGGAEPAELFSESFLKGLSSLLKPNGVIAINYATDIYLPSASYVFTTILSIFPNCRLFRDSDPAASSSSSVPSDFTNMVLFCRKSEARFDFRQPGESDFLGTQARRMLLMPNYEVPLQRFVGEKKEDKWDLDESRVLKKRRIQQLEKWHGVGAARHWKLMRTVMPDIIWERW